MESQTKIIDIAVDLLEQWVRVGGSLTAFKNMSILEVVESAYKNGLVLKFEPLDNTKE